MVITVSLTMHSYLIRGLSEGQNYSIQIGFHYKYGHSRGLWSKPAFYIVPETENSSIYIYNWYNWKYKERHIMNK